MLLLNNSVSTAPGVETRNAKKLNSLGIRTIEDLLYSFPFRYKDFSLQKNISEVKLGETVTVRGRVLEIKSVPLRGRKNLTEAYIEDETGSIKAVWFNFMMPLRFLSKGKYIQLSGKISVYRGKEAYFQHPNFELISKTVYDQKQKLSSKTGSTSGLAPVYSENRNVNSYFLRRVIQKTLPQITLQEFIPANFLQEQKE